MTNKYEIDAAHSSLQFSVRHMMISNVRGSFTGVKGTVTYDPANPAALTVVATVDASTVNSNDTQRDGHLKGPDFFDIAQFPTITFTSREAEKKSESEYLVVGDLTIHGVTKQVVLNVEDVSSEAKDPWGNQRIGASAKTKVKRSDFGLTSNTALEAGGVLVGDEVKLEFEIEMVKASGATA